MTPKEKAEELVNELIHYSSTNQKPSLENAKQCALIAVDEILEECILERDWYWQEVKNEINKL